MMTLKLRTIGNFILLPKGQNSSLQDRDWPVKQLFLKILLQDSLVARKDLVNEAKAKGIDLPPKIESVTKGPLLKSHMLNGLEDVKRWDKTFIEKRSKRICKLVWSKMKEWLD